MSAITPAGAGRVTDESELAQSVHSYPPPPALGENVAMRALSAHGSSSSPDVLANHPGHSAHEQELSEQGRETDEKTKAEFVIITPAPDISGKGESGWSAVASSIRKVDFHKIKDVQDDLDNILVFAGLYSAVLSALIALSILALQPDATATMIVLLTQITVQTHSYIITPGSLNSTVPPLNVTDVINSSFKPSLSAKRVNVLWFSSLTLALITASFAILVKQWLREYLAGKYVSPQAQLRVRHFRTPGLKHWRVFGIASFLSLVLQLSLALFFVGLCFFTLNIDTSIGYTTIPLVAGWALLLISTAFAPSISPRCPYKLPLLKPLLQIMRPALFQIIAFAKGLQALPVGPDWGISTWTWLSLNYVEEEMGRDPRFDADILCEIYSHHRDEELLLRMSNAARETLPTPEAKLDFALKILSFLLDEDASQLSMMHDMSKLTSRSCTILADLIADGLRPQLQRFRSSHEFDWDHNPWSWDSLMLLLAKLPCLLSKEASATVALCFSTTDPYLNGVFQRIFPLAVTTGEDLHGRNEVIHEHNKDERSTNALHLLERLDQVLYQIDITYVLGALQALFHSAFCTCSTCKDLRECWETHTADIPHLAIDHACDILAKCVLRDVQAGVSWNGWHDDIMLILCVRSRELPDNAPIAWHSNFKDLVHFILLSRALTPCFSLILYDRVRQEVDYMNVFHSIFIKSAQKVAILRNLHDAFRNYVEEIQKEPHLNDIYFRNSVLRFLRRQIDLMQDTITHGVPQDAVAMHYMTTWRSILNTIHRALQGFDALQVESEADITIRAENILAEIDTLDAAWSIMCGEGLRADPDPDTDFENWATQFDPRDEFVSDEVVIDLLRLLPSTKQSVKSRRARRIDYLRNHPSLLSALSPESRNSGHPEYNWCGAAQPAESQENSSSPEEVLVQVPEDTRPSTTQLNGPDQTEQPAQPPNITDFWGPAYSNTGGTAVEEMHGRTAKGRENSDSGPASVVQSSAGSVDLLPPTRIPDSTPIPPLLSEVHDPGKAREPVDIERLSIPHSSDYPEKGTLTG